MALGEQAAQGVSFLLVDDNEAFLGLLSSFVRRHYPDCHLGLAATGEQALQQLISGDWDVVLLDYRLPDVDGLEVLAEIRKRQVDTAVVMVTGEGDERLAADIFRMGAHDYLVKSAIDPSGIRRCLDQVLMRRLLEAQIAEKSGELVRSSRELAERTRALDTAYEKLHEKKEQLRHLSDSLEQTVQRRTAELRKTTRFLNKVLDATVDHFVVAAGPDGTIRTLNRGAELAFGRVATKTVGELHFRELFDELADDAALAGLVAAIHAKGSLTMDLTGRASGGGFAAEVSLSVLSLSSEEDDGLVILGWDVTHERELEDRNQAYVRQIEVANEDLRRKNEQILEATRLKSEFLANVSHELRTPLNAIIGYSDLLSGGIYGELEGKQASAILGIGTRAKDLLALINEILDLAKIEAGRMNLRLERFMLSEVISEVVETGRVLAVDKAVEVSWDQDGDDLELTTDPQKLQQILINLVSNAVKFTPVGTVRVETRVEGTDLVVLVRDTGIGIPREELAKVFDEFRQVDGTSTREYGGTGLGLAISQKFAVCLGGDLFAESRLGEGSAFTLRIPTELGPSEQTRHIAVALDLTPDLAAITGD